MNFDFHLHSTFSDGSSTMEDIFIKGKELNLNAIAITDHDTTLGLNLEKQLSEKYDIPCIPAAEFTAVEKGVKLHVLGYHIDKDSKELYNYSSNLLNYFDERSKKQIEILRANGIDIPEDEYFKQSQGGPLYRAKLLKTLANFGYLDAKDIMTSLKKYFGPDGICYVPDEFKYNDFESTINLIKRNKGIAVLAHPIKIKNKNEDLYYELINSNLIDGIEIYHPSITQEIKVELEDVVTKKDLIITGGSDYHGLYNKKGTPLSGMNVPDFVYHNLMTIK
ncbi:PHP domain-containing protein [Clostridium algidicarnis]|uniref:PHP domain-containing protein n=1 Tax=Clostridium algidicarnis TaxID=37659 RepID=UPI001C0DD3F9|nr:PHP domain-containing protein [Clostridium algidicarnis]MBU3205322.1 PHP domain-containing protein [Clostridium algidicarnis]MBU3213475.1 PHP domain-containing protein [Clostridium algidicarnis]MBU3223283.1 PHP domain-containing protein [Clostridium algidicarnis]